MMNKRSISKWAPRCARIGAMAVVLAGACSLATGVLAGGTGSTGSFGGARIGSGGAFSGYSGSLGGTRPGSSVIRHGGTGFSIYSQRGVTRVIGEPTVSKRVLLPDGRSARVIGDSDGGARVYGAPGNHRILGNPRLFGDHP